MTDRPKLIYLARRHPSLAAADFTARWRQHGRLGMSLPRWRNIWRYAQCDVVPWPASPLPLDAGYDGVALVWYRSAATRAAHTEDADRAVMARDERETFDRPVRECNFLAREIVLAPPPAGRVKLFRFLFAEPGAAGQAVADRLAGPRATLLGRALRDGGAGYVLNLAADGAGSGLGCIAVDEIACDSPAIAERLLTPPLMAEVAAAETGAVARTISVLTRESVLYQLDAPAPAGSAA